LPDREHVDASWGTILRELEDDLERLRAGLPTEGEPRITSAEWSAPAIPGPLPDEYAQYVLGLIEAQREAIERLERSRQTTLVHLDALRAVGSAIDQPGSVYLDVEG
jgi:hypothetical protein